MLFNWFGYRLLTSFLEEKVNSQLEAQLDNNNYDETQLISIKIPVTYLPYYNNSKSFERIDGQIEIEGVQYKYVKRRIYNDSLELLCIPNPDVMRLQVAKNEFFKFVNDLQHTGAGKNETPHPDSSKNFSVDCYTGNDLFEITDPYFSILLITSHYFIHLTSRHALIVEQPPENC